MYAAAAKAKTATIIRVIGEVAIATTVPNAATAIAAIPPAAAIAVNIPAMGPTSSSNGPTTAKIPAKARIAICIGPGRLLKAPAVVATVADTAERIGTSAVPTVSLTGAIAVLLLSCFSERGSVESANASRA